MYSSVLALFVISSVFIDAAVSLQCIECSSLDDAKCGRTLEYSMDEARDNDMVTTCEGSTVACRKTESKDSINNMVVVSRSCWNATGAEVLNDDFLKCKDLMVHTEVCYCTGGDNDDPCNGQQRINANFIVFLLGLLLFILKSLF